LHRGEEYLPTLALSAALKTVSRWRFSSEGDRGVPKLILHTNTRNHFDWGSSTAYFLTMSFSKVSLSSIGRFRQLAILSVLYAFSGCAGRNVLSNAIGTKPPLDQKKLFYRFEETPAFKGRFVRSSVVSELEALDAKAFASEVPDILFRSLNSKSSIVINSACRAREAVPAKDVLNQLLLGFRTKENAAYEAVSWKHLTALEWKGLAEFERQTWYLHIRAVTTGFCTLDVTFLSQPEVAKSDQVIFLEFLKGFSFES